MAEFFSGQPLYYLTIVANIHLKQQSMNAICKFKLKLRTFSLKSERKKCLKLPLLSQCSSYQNKEEMEHKRNLT